MIARFLPTWNWSARFEVKFPDLWVGVYWKYGELNTDVWLCLVPCLPLHIMLRRVKCERCGAVVKRVYTDSAGVITACCIECAWNPNGCRCRFGEFGKEDTDNPYNPVHDLDDESFF